MVSGLFINSCILISALFVSSVVFKDTVISPRSPLKHRVLIGVIGGALGIILILYSIHVEGSIIFDFRHIAQMIVALHGGLLAVVVSSVVIALFRLFHLGLSGQSMAAVLVIMIIGAGCGLISLLKLSNIKKWIMMSVGSVIAISLLMLFLVKDVRVLTRVLLELWLGSFLLGMLVYKLMDYIILSHSMLDRLKQECTVDFLTGLNNTRSYDYLFNKAAAEALRANTSLALLIIDIDFFKKINDTYGHTAGDMVLKELGQLLLKTCRAADTVARIGGEEFAVIIKDTEKTELKNMAERIREEVQKSIFHVPGKVIHISVSVGGAVYPETVEQLEILKEAADNKLYEAKRTGRNKVCI